MNWDFLQASVFNLLMNVLYAMVSLLVAFVSLGLVDRILLTKVNIQEELQKNNLSVAVVASSILLFVAIIISFGLKG